MVIPFLSAYALPLSILSGFLAIFYGLYLAKWVVTQPTGNQAMNEIADAIALGAKAYLKRQYTVVAQLTVIIFFILLLFLGFPTALGFALGATASAAAGFIGMNISVRGNVRTAEAANFLWLRQLNH